MVIRDILPFAHELTRRALRAGGVAVDATSGNGHDTVHLASIVGKEGRVYAIDRQEQAVTATRHKVTTRVPEVDVRIIQGDHAALRDHVAPEDRGEVGAVMFNLGYLPRGDHDVITTPETTLPALDAAVDLLAHGGVVTAVLYTGHEGGPEEADAVRGWADCLPQDKYRVLSYQFTNRTNHPPRLLAIEKHPA